MALLTLRQLTEIYPGFTRYALRNLFGHRKENGLSSTVVKVGARKILIDQDRFEQWLEARREQDE